MLHIALCDDEPSFLTHMQELINRCAFEISGMTKKLRSAD